ncbi:MAG: DUF2786 domain-containing protein [Pseudomonadota bacterium]
MTKHEVLEKVRKLFELGRSPNENEAALAAAKARELLTRYNLSVADLPMDKMRNALEIAEQAVIVGKTLKNWVKGLLVHVADGFECQHLIRRRSDGNPPLLTFIGAETDAQVAVYTFLFLFGELNHMADEALPALKSRNKGWHGGSLRFAYLDGAVRRIGERFKEKSAETREMERRQCSALVVAKTGMIQDYVEATFRHIRKDYCRNRTVSARAFEQGYRDAEDLNLRPGGQGAPELEESRAV